MTCFTSVRPRTASPSSIVGDGKSLFPIAASVIVTPSE